MFKKIIEETQEIEKNEINLFDILPLEISAYTFNFLSDKELAKNSLISKQFNLFANFNLPERKKLHYLKHFSNAIKAGDYEKVNELITGSLVDVNDGPFLHAVLILYGCDLALIRDYRLQKYSYVGNDLKQLAERGLKNFPIVIKLLLDNGFDVNMKFKDDPILTMLGLGNKHFFYNDTPAMVAKKYIKLNQEKNYGDESVTYLVQLVDTIDKIIDSSNIRLEQNNRLRLG